MLGGLQGQFPPEQHHTRKMTNRAGAKESLHPLVRRVKCSTASGLLMLFLPFFFLVFPSSSASLVSLLQASSKA